MRKSALQRTVDAIETRGWNGDRVNQANQFIKKAKKSDKKRKVEKASRKRNRR